MSTSSKSTTSSSSDDKIEAVLLQQQAGFLPNVRSEAISAYEAAYLKRTGHTSNLQAETKDVSDLIATTIIPEIINGLKAEEPGTFTELHQHYRLFQKFIVANDPDEFCFLDELLAKSTNWKSRSYDDSLFKTATYVIEDGVYDISLAGWLHIHMILRSKKLREAFLKLKEDNLETFTLSLAQVATEVDMREADYPGVYIFSPDSLTDALAKIYVGWSINLKQRWACHCCDDINAHIEGYKKANGISNMDDWVARVVYEPNIIDVPVIGYLYEFTINLATRATSPTNFNFNTLDWPTFESKLSGLGVLRLWIWFLTKCTVPGATKDVRAVWNGAQHCLLSTKSPLLSHPEVKEITGPSFDSYTVYTILAQTSWKGLTDQFPIYMQFDASVWLKKYLPVNSQPQGHQTGQLDSSLKTSKPKRKQMEEKDLVPLLEVSEEAQDFVSSMFKPKKKKDKHHK